VYLLSFDYCIGNVIGKIVYDYWLIVELIVVLLFDSVIGLYIFHSRIRLFGKLLCLCST